MRIENWELNIGQSLTNVQFSILIRPAIPKSLWVPPQDITNENQNAKNHDQRVILHVSGLDQAHRPAGGLDEAADESDRAIHNPSIPPARSAGAPDCRPCRTI